MTPYELGVRAALEKLGMAPSRPSTWEQALRESSIDEVFHHVDAKTNTVDNRTDMSPSVPTTESAP